MGQYAGAPPDAVLRALAGDDATGCLTVLAADGRQARVWLQSGRVCALAVPGHRPRIGVRLLSSGLISPEDLAEALEQQRREPGLRLGEALVRLGAVEPALVESFIAEQLRDQAADLLGWTAVDEDFTPGGEPYEVDVSPPVGVDDLLDDAVLRRARWAEVASVIGGQDAVPTLGAGEADDADVVLGPHDWALLCKVDGHRSVADLADECGFTLVEAGQLVQALLGAGMLMLSGTDSEPGPLDDQWWGSDLDDDSIAESLSRVTSALADLLTSPVTPRSDAAPSPVLEPDASVEPEGDGGATLAPEPAATQGTPAADTTTNAPAAAAPGTAATPDVPAPADSSLEAAVTTAPVPDAGALPVPLPPPGEGSPAPLVPEPGPIAPEPEPLPPGPEPLAPEPEPLPPGPEPIAPEPAPQPEPLPPEPAPQPEPLPPEPVPVPEPEPTSVPQAQPQPEPVATDSVSVEAATPAAEPLPLEPEIADAYADPRAAAVLLTEMLRDSAAEVPSPRATPAPGRADPATAPTTAPLAEPVPEPASAPVPAGPPGTMLDPGDAAALLRELSSLGADEEPAAPVRPAPPRPAPPPAKEKDKKKRGFFGR